MMMMMGADGAWWDFRLQERHHRGCVHQDTFQSTKYIPPMEYHILTYISPIVTYRHWSLLHLWWYFNNDLRGSMSVLYQNCFTFQFYASCHKWPLMAFHAGVRALSGIMFNAASVRQGIWCPGARQVWVRFISRRWGHGSFNPWERGEGEVSKYKYKCQQIQIHIQIQIQLKCKPARIIPSQ